jgi:DNA-binding response OmpR family regulator
VYLPSEPDADRSPVALAQRPPRGKETVLVVDDEPAIRATIYAILRDAGFAPIAAASGEEALALLAEPGVAAGMDLVILDVSMPGMPSNVLRTRLRELAPNAKVLYFTGYAWDASDTGDAVLEKPVSSAMLLATVRDVLDRTHGAYSNDRLK